MHEREEFIGIDEEYIDVDKSSVDGVSPGTSRPPSPSLDLPPAKKQKRSHIRRQKKRAEQHSEMPKAKTLRTVLNKAVEVKTDVNTEALPACRGAYRAKPDGYQNPSKKYTLSDLFSIGLTLIRWDGM
jgi:hypothetical protein